MLKHTRFDDYPQRIRYGTERPEAVYARVPGYYAVHGRPSGAPAPGAVLLLEEQAIAVFEGEAEGPPAATLTPVYALEPNGPLAVPTGRVFVRFAEGVDVETRRDALHRAGYEVAQRLAYAPQAAWLRAHSGEPAHALANIPALEALPDVENVEPQMLTEPARRR